jgi:carbonic anhydrase
MKTSFEHYVATKLTGLAAQEKPRILLLTCIDYRYAHRITSVMDSMKLTRKYDMFALAGAAAGANQNGTWRQTLVEHIRVARQIEHLIDRIIILEHRDCGAYKKFFGLEWDNVTPPVEEACHEREVGLLITFLKREFATDIPNLVIDSLLSANLKPAAGCLAG